MKDLERLVALYLPRAVLYGGLFDKVGEYIAGYSHNRTWI